MDCMDLLTLQELSASSMYIRTHFKGFLKLQKNKDAAAKATRNSCYGIDDTLVKKRSEKQNRTSSAPELCVLFHVGPVDLVT